jgi:spoIIIJ-associated protein
MADAATHPTTTDQETEMTEQTTDAAELPEPDQGEDTPEAGTGAVDTLPEPAGDETDPDRPTRAELLEQEGDIAADYLEELLDIADLDGDIDMDVEGDRAAVSIVGGDLGKLVGQSGEVLDALQELTRLAVLRETGERSRLMLDIGGHRAERRAALEKLAQESVDQVKESGEPVALDPMTPFERKVVHDVVATAGLVSDSEGVEPKRYVVVRPA